MKDHKEEMAKIIKNNMYCTIATADLNGKPWISPVFFGFDQDYNIYWVSSKDSLHSKLIRENPSVVIVIFNSQAPEGEGDGVYLEATAYELEDLDEVKSGVKIRDSRVKVEQFKVKKIEEVIGDGAWRVYKAIPERISKLSDGEYINDQYIDKRVEIHLRD